MPERRRPASSRRGDSAPPPYFIDRISDCEANSEAPPSPVMSDTGLRRNRSPSPENPTHSGPRTASRSAPWPLQPSALASTPRVYRPPGMPPMFPSAEGLPHDDPGARTAIPSLNTHPCRPLLRSEPRATPPRIQTNADHISREGEDRRTDTDTGFFCPLCPNKWFASQRDLERHTKAKAYQDPRDSRPPSDAQLAHLELIEPTPASPAAPVPSPTVAPSYPQVEFPFLARRSPL